MASQLDPDWDHTYVTMVSPADADPALFVLIEMWGCQKIRFGGPNDEAIEGHQLSGKGLDSYCAHGVLNSDWIEDAIKVNSVHPNHSDAGFRRLHDEMLEALAGGISSRFVMGTMREVLEELTGSLIGQP